MKKIICLLLIILLLSSLLLFFSKVAVKAAYNSKFANYPGYKELLEDLQKDHPDWEFEILETGLDWEDVVKAETVAKHGRSLISKYDSAYDCCPRCGTKQYEKGWYCASTTAVKYYLDPRNSICEDYIFQFEQLTYDSKNQTEEGVKKILADCDYMQGTITYYDTKGQKQTLKDKTYIGVVMEAAKAYNVSPYHIASRIRQELGTGKGSSMVSGTYGSYKGYYNYFNWGAYGDDIMGSGLQTAKKYGWTDPEKAIKGGVEKLAQEYIGVGQDTLYLQKFDVVDGGNQYYWHQYMTNISASKSEGLTTKNAYLKMGMLSKDSKIKFKIPVYKNMPTSKCAAPGKETIVTQDVQLNKETNIRKGKGTNTEILVTLAKGTKLLRIELASAKDSSGIYWDKVVLSNGNKGYATRDNLTLLSTQSNCNEKYIAVNQLTLRNGPGTESTDIIQYISAGQTVTAIEKEKYINLNGENWYRIKITDGSIGYIAIGTTKDPNIVKYDETSQEYGYIKVICTDGLNIRSAPKTSSSTYITTIPTGTKLLRIQKNASTNEGFVWDKIVTDSGIVGYIVNQDKNTKEPWVEEIKDTSIIGNGFKTTESNLVCQPNITVASIKKIAKDAVIKKGTTTITDTANVGTGYTVTYHGKTYTVIVMGDVNGDGKVNTGDTLAMSQHIEKYKSIKDSNYLKAADVNGDGKVNTGDSLAMRQHVENFKSLKLY